MRRRLIGAAALLVGTAVVVPMMLDPTPPPLPDNIPLDIPSERTPFAPRLSLPAAAPSAAAAKPSEAPVAAKPAGDAATQPAVPDSAPSVAPGTAEGKSDAKAGWFVQAAAFSSESAARQLSERLTKAGMVPFVQRSESSGSTLYRVRLGPFASREAAVKARRHLHAMGVGSNVVRVDQAER